MKTKMSVIVILVSALFLFTGCAEMAYKKASETNNIKTYRQFVSKHPDSEFTPQAKEKIEELYWQQTKNQNSISAYGAYLQKYPAGKYAKDAEVKTEDMVWDSAKTIQAYEQYLEKYPGANMQKMRRQRWKMWIGIPQKLSRLTRHIS